MRDKLLQERSRICNLLNWKENFHFLLFDSKNNELGTNSESNWKLEREAQVRWPSPDAGNSFRRSSPRSSAWLFPDRSAEDVRLSICCRSKRCCSISSRADFHRTNVSVSNWSTFFCSIWRKTERSFSTNERTFIFVSSSNKTKTKHQKLKSSNSRIIRNVTVNKHFSLSHFAWELSESTGCGNCNNNRLKKNRNHSRNLDFLRLDSLFRTTTVERCFRHVQNDFRKLCFR